MSQHPNTRKIRTRRDAAWAISALPPDRHRFNRDGTIEGAINWLYQKRIEVNGTMGLLAALDQYKREWALFGSCTDRENKRLAERDEKRAIRLEQASYELARRVVRMRREPHGEHAFEMLYHLAVNQGVVLVRHEEEPPLRVLHKFLVDGRRICRNVGTRLHRRCTHELLAMRGDINQRLFSRLERTLVRTPLHDHIDPTPLVLLAVGLVLDDCAFELVEGALKGIVDSRMEAV